MLPAEIEASPGQVIREVEDIGPDGKLRVRVVQELNCNVEVAGESGRSMTKQSMRDEVDVNTIVDRFTKGAMIDYVNERSPAYLDVSDMADFRTALAHVRETTAFFNQLPADLRAKFGNDPATFMDFMVDGMNRDEAVKLGLVPVDQLTDSEKAAAGVKPATT